MERDVLRLLQKVLDNLIVFHQRSSSLVFTERSGVKNQSSVLLNSLLLFLNGCPFFVYQWQHRQPQFFEERIMTFCGRGNLARQTGQFSMNLL